MKPPNEKFLRTPLMKQRIQQHALREIQAKNSQSQNVELSEPTRESDAVKNDFLLLLAETLIVTPALWFPAAWPDSIQPQLSRFEH